MPAPISPAPQPDPERLLEQVAEVRRLARVLVADAGQAEDVAQEALLTAIKRPPRPGWTWKAWLRGLVRRKASEARRSQRRRLERERHGLPVPAEASPVDIAGQVETHRLLLNALMALPEPYRRVIWMRFFEHRSPRAIGQLLEVPTETVRTRLRRGIDRLRRELTARHGGDRDSWRASVALLAGDWTDTLRGALWEGLSMTVKGKACLGLAAAILVGLGLYAAGVRLGREAERRPEGGSEVASARPGDARGVGPVLEGRIELPGDEGEAARSPTVAGIAALLRGRVVEDSTGRPLETARVGICCPGEAALPPERMVPVKADGTFEVVVPLECVGAPTLCVLARAPDHVQLQVCHARVEDALELRLSRGVSIAGTVEAPWGTRIAGATVRARVPWNLSGWPATEWEVVGPGSLGGLGRTDGLGAFVIHGLSEGQEYDVVASKDGYGFRGGDYERVKAPFGGVQVRMWPEARVRFVDQRNREAAESGLATAVWLPTLMFHRNPPLRGIGSAFWQNGCVLEERFLLDREVDLEADIPFVFQVLTEAHGWRQVAGAARAGKTVTIELPSEGDEGARVPLIVTARFTGGAEFSGHLNMTLARLPAGGAAFVRLPIESGRAKVPLSLLPGEYVVEGAQGGDLPTAFWTPFTERRVRVSHEGAAVELELKGSAYRLDVRDETGRPVRDYLLQVEREAGSASGWYPHPSPEAALATVSAPTVWLGEGAHVVRVGTPVRGFREVEVSAPSDGRLAPLEITLRAGKDVDLWASRRRVRGGPR